MKKAQEQLRNGGLLYLPSATGWVLGGDATRESTISALLAQVTAPQTLCLLLWEASMLDRYLHKVPEIAWDLVEFAEKPLVIVYPKGKNVAPNLLHGNQDIAISIVKDTLSYGILQAFGKPIAVIRATPSDIFPHVEAPNGWKPQPETIMQLGINGEFSFLKR